MTVGSIFSGIGGIDLGFERAGFDIKWQIELDWFRRAILKKHWPNVKRYIDVRTATPEEQVDVIVGGFPCKQTSLAAATHDKRVGLAGKDSGLYADMLRIVRLVRPRVVVTENVEGALSSAAEITRHLAESGYELSIKPLTVSAEALGAPHCRRRVFWVAHRYGERLAIPRYIESPSIVRSPWRAFTGNTWLSNLSGTMRVDDGLSSRVDSRLRIAAIGDSCVPQVAEWVARLVKQGLE
jgi:DNA (cytosine-5)-methyltransferase 1